MSNSRVAPSPTTDGAGAGETATQLFPNPLPQLPPEAELLAQDVADVQAILPIFDAPQTYTDFQQTVLADGWQMLATFNGVSHSTLKTGTKLSKAKVTDGGDHVMAGVEATIRAPIGNVVAYITGRYSRYNEMNYAKRSYSLVVFERPSDHMHFKRGLYPTPFPLTDREAIMCGVWERVSDTEFIIVHAFGPHVTHPSYPERDDLVRVSGTRVAVVKKITDSITSVSDVSFINL